MIERTASTSLPMVVGHCLLAVTTMSPAAAQPPLASDSEPRSETSVTTAADPNWTLHTVDRVVLDTRLIRLQDVVTPSQISSTTWNSLRRGVIALIPVGHDRVRVQRSRLAEALRRMVDAPSRIVWTGADTIEVVYRSSAKPDAGRREDHPAIVSSDPTRQATDDGQPIASNEIDEPASIDPATQARLETWIAMAVRRNQTEIAEQYQLTLPSNTHNADAMKHLSSASGIVSASFASVPQATDEQIIAQAIHVTGRSVEGPIDATLTVHLKPHPLVVVPRRALRRGHRIAAKDLDRVPLPPDRWRDDYGAELGDFVGMEVIGNATEGRPLSRRSLSRPTLVRRGEVIEVRVVGGGVSVTTAAKALGNGHDSQLIEIETLGGHRTRTVARVVGVGQVEIVTRSPTVRSQ